MQRRILVHLFTTFLFVLDLRGSSAIAATVEALGDARIDHDEGSGSWTVSAGGASMTITIDPSKDYAVTSMVSPAGHDWLRARATDTIVTVDGVRHIFGSRSSGFTYTSASTRKDGP